jgi:hypothetical protein
MSSSARPTGSTLAIVQLVSAIGVGIAAWLIAPDLSTSDRHKEFVDFFATSAAVIAALLIALAIEARHVIRGKFLASVTALSVAAGLLSAVASLSPDLPTCMYRWLFAFTVGGGVGGLVAALVVGAQTLSAEIDEARLDELNSFLKRTQEDARRRADEGRRR